MNEYIERAAALDAVKRTSGDYMAAWSEIAHMQAANVAEVVRCGQCRYSGPASKLSQKYGAPGVLTCHGPMCNRRNVTETDFCSHGARMDKEDET